MQSSQGGRKGPDWCTKANPHDEGVAHIWCGIDWSVRSGGVRPWRPSDFRGRGGLLDLFTRQGKPFRGIGSGMIKRDEHSPQDEQSFIGYNEVVVASDAWLDHLPWSVQAIFFIECPNGEGEANLKYGDAKSAWASNTCGEAEEKAREMHAAFLRAYPEIQPDAFPLLRLQTDNWENPFEDPNPPPSPPKGKSHGKSGRPVSPAHR